MQRSISIAPPEHQRAVLQLDVRIRSDVEVPDPYGKGVEEYNKCFEQLYSYVEKVVKVISAPKNEAD